MPVTRRSFLLGSAAVATSPLWGPMSPARADVAVAAHPIRAANRLRDAFGVVVHFASGDSPYVTQYEDVRKELGSLGVRHMRDRVAVSQNPTTNEVTANRVQVENLAEICTTFGIKLDCVTAPPKVGVPNDIATLHDLARTGGKLAGRVASVEGANEYNGEATDWASALYVRQQELWSTFKNDASTSGIQIVAPSLKKGFANDNAPYKELGATGIGAYCDMGNIHAYPNRNVPSVLVSEALSAERQYVLQGSTSKKILATEAGYFTAPLVEGGSVTEKAQGLYTPRLLAEHIRAGSWRQYCYELVDEPNRTDSVKEQNFGLIKFNALGEPIRKPAYTAMQNMLALFPLGTVTSPQPLTYGFTTTASDLKHLCFQQEDSEGRRSWLLVMWRDVPVVDSSGLDVTVDPVSVKLLLQTAAYVDVYRPSLSDTKTASTSSPVTGPVFSVPGDLYVLHIKPA